MHSSLGRREFQWHLCVVPCASIHKTAENVQTKGMLKRFSFYLLPHHHPFSFSKQISRASWLLSFQEISSPRTNPAPGFQTCPASDGHEMGCKNNYSDCFLTSPVQVSLSLPLGYLTYFTEAGTILYTEWTIYQQLTTEGQQILRRWWEGGSTSHFSTKNKIQSPFQRRGNMWHLQEESLFSHQHAFRSIQKWTRCPFTQQLRELGRLRLEGQKQQMHPRFLPFVKVWIRIRQEEGGRGGMITLFWNHLKYKESRYPTKKQDSPLK